MKGISTINNLRGFVQETTGCTREKAKKLASEYATKVGKTTFSCNSKTYPDATQIERIYDGWNRTFSVIGKHHDTKKKLKLIREFLDNAAAESAYFARKV